MGTTSAVVREPLVRRAGQLADVQLRPLESTDFRPVHALLSDWEVVRYMLLPLCTEQASEAFVRDAIADAHPAWQSIVRAIIKPDTNQFAGLCGMVILRGGEEGEIWYLLDRRFRRCGLATAAVARLVGMAFAELGLHRVWACCVPENEPSARVLERIGMRQEGLRRRNLNIHGEWKDSLQYAILMDEWADKERFAAAAPEPENVRLVLQFIDRLINRSDLSAVDELLAPDYLDHDAPADQPPGARGVKVMFSIYRVAGGRIAERWGPVPLGLNLAETTGCTHGPFKPQ